MAEPEQALYTYSACRLYQLGQSTYPNSSRLLPRAWNTIRELGIAVRRPTKRGCRGGRQRQHQQAISTVIGHRPISPYVRVRSSQQHHDNLIPVTLTANPLVWPTTTASLCIFNARSVRNKTTDILDHIHEHDLDIVAITETWLTNKDSDLSVTRALTPTGYNLIHHPRCGRRGGGIAILHKESVKATSLKTFSNTHSFEAMSLKLTLFGKCVILLVVYRPPPNKKNGSSVVDFFKEFADILDIYATLPDELVIVGDLNLNFDINTDVHVRRFRVMLDSHGMTQYVEVAIHQEGHILDLIIARTYSCVMGTVVADLISDHCAVHCRIAMRKHPFRRELKTYRKMKAINLTSFSTDIENSDLCTSQERSLEESVTQYNDVLGDLLEKHAPLKTKWLTIRPAAPWVNDDILSARKERRRMERRWRLSRLNVDREIFMNQRDIVKKMLYAAKSEFYANRIKDQAGNPKALFRTVGSLLQTKRLPALPNEHLGQLLDEFSNYFIDKVDIIRRDLDNIDNCVSMRPDESCGISSYLSSFMPTTTDENTKLVSKSACKSCKLDPIPTHLLKDNLSSLAPVIADIVNMSIATGVFPSVFKKALITPLLKKTTLDANDVPNYRPVSNLCFVSNIVEKVVAVRFSKHLSDNDLYEQMQSAYRPNHSTETALLRVRNDLLCIFEERKAAILVLLDLSAAFDTIDHTIMLTRLRDRFGITATCLAWFESYLVNRSQRI